MQAIYAGILCKASKFSSCLTLLLPRTYFTLFGMIIQTDLLALDFSADGFGSSSTNS
jgi:hypothetical protein